MDARVRHHPWLLFSRKHCWPISLRVVCLVLQLPVQLVLAPQAAHLRRCKITVSSCSMPGVQQCSMSSHYVQQRRCIGRHCGCAQVPRLQTQAATGQQPDPAPRCGLISQATRRDIAMLPALLIAAGPAACTAESNHAAAEGALNARYLDPDLAAAFISSAYTAAYEQQLLPEAQFQAEVSRLREREWPYYYAANKERLQHADNPNGGNDGLSNLTFMNFASYIVWKVVVTHAATPQQRTQVCTSAAAALLQQVAPDTLQTLRASAAAGGKAPSTAVVAAVADLLNRLQAGSYIQGWQLTWGELPGTWPSDWTSSEAQLAGEVPDSGFADSRSFQVKLSRPADLECCVALRAEERGFFPSLVSSMLKLLMSAGGYEHPEVDEYFAQDYWSGPMDAKSRLLLALGDPLNVVQVPWNPTTLVQDWQL